MRKPHCSGPINGVDVLFSLVGSASALIASDYLINKNFSSDTRDMGHEISGLIGLGVLAAYFLIRVCRYQCYNKK